MINIEQTIQQVIAATDCRVPILAAPFDLPTELCRDLVARGLIRGYVANRKERDGVSDARIAGWWDDRDNGSWSIRRSACRELLFLGTETQIAGRMLFVARRAGILTFYLHDASGDQPRHLHVGKLLRSRTKSALLGRTLGVAKGYVFSNQSYEKAFQDLYDEVGDTFRVAANRHEPKRVLLILGSLGPGGAERQASLTAIGLARDGRWKPVIGCSHVEGESANFHRSAVEQAGVAVEAIPITPPAMSDSKIQKILGRTQQYRHIGFQNVAHNIISYACFISKMRPELVQTWMDTSNVLAGIAADMVGVPALVLSGRSVAPDNFAIFQPYMRPGYLELLRRRPAVFTNNSRAGGTDYARWLGLPTDRFRVVHNGFEFPTTRPVREAAAIRESLGIPATGAVVGSIFRFSEEKRPHVWIETAAKVIARLSSVYFVAFGDGVMLEEIRERVATMGLTDKIKLPGITKQAWHSLTMMNVFLLTSRMEGLPNVLVEAQAMGVPVVTTGQGGMPETYQNEVTGLTVPATDAEAFAVQIMRLLSDPARLQSMSAAASQYARNTFGVELMIRSTLNVFDHAQQHQTNDLLMGNSRWGSE